MFFTALSRSSYYDNKTPLAALLLLFAYFVRCKGNEKMTERQASGCYFIEN